MFHICGRNFSKKMIKTCIDHIFKNLAICCALNLKPITTFLNFYKSVIILTILVFKPVKSVLSTGTSCPLCPLNAARHFERVHLEKPAEFTRFDAIT